MIFCGTLSEEQHIHTALISNKFSSISQIYSPPAYKFPATYATCPTPSCFYQCLVSFHLYLNCRGRLNFKMYLFYNLKIIFKTNIFLKEEKAKQSELNIFLGLLIFEHRYRKSLAEKICDWLFKTTVVILQPVYVILK